MRIRGGLKRRIHYGMRNKGNVIFEDKFEERKTIEYLLNLSGSVLISKMLSTFTDCVKDILGADLVFQVINGVYPLRKYCNESIDVNDILEGILKYVPEKTLTNIVNNQIANLLQERLSKLRYAKKEESEKRLLQIQTAFKLSNAELEILTFYYLFDNLRSIQGLFNQRLEIDNAGTFRNFGHTITGCKKRDILRAFSEGRLFYTRLLIFKHNSFVGAEDWVHEYLSGVGKRDIKHDFFNDRNDCSLHLDDLEIPEDEKAVLEMLLISADPCNILFYGEPGTGKTSLAKSLARAYNKTLFTVRIPEDNDINSRIRAIHATLNFADAKRALILIDEADELLNSYNTAFYQSKVSKSWINNLIESQKHKLIWITNMSSTIHPSTMRRFSFTMEFKHFSHKNRVKVLKHELRHKRLSGFFTEAELDDLCNTYSVNAGGIVNALTLLKPDKQTNKETAIKHMKTILRNFESATTDKQPDAKKKTSYKHYSLEGMNCSENLDNIVALTKRYAELKEKESERCPSSISMLLYGMPGTGKSEFVYYLGYSLAKEVLLRRSSEIQSMWVGETEKNIANAFREAQEMNAILFFDEADSFLFPRMEASRSWEKSHTNEILTQLESYRGIVIFATNDIGGLDHASLRRFRFKMHFMPLSPEGNLIFYNAFLKPIAQTAKG